MPGRWEGWEPSLVFVSSVGCIFLFLFLTQQPAVDPTNPGSFSYLSTLAAWLQLTKTDPFVAVLQAVNIVTFFYGIWFYAIRIGTTLGRSLALATLTLCVGFHFFSYYMKVYADMPNPAFDKHQIFVFKEYAVSISLLLWFSVVDYLRSRNTAGDEAALLAFSSFYISLPSLVALLLTLFLHFVLLGYTASPDRSIAFLTGSTAVVLLLSNLVLALISNPIYASRLRLTLRPENSHSEGTMKKLALTGVGASIVGVLAFFAAISVTFLPGVAALYPATAFEAAFGSWFGIWGAIASFIGLLVAGTAGGWFALPTGVLLSLSDFVMALAPAIAVRFFGLDPSLPNWKQAAYFVLIVLFFGSLPGSLWYNYINLQLGQLSGWNSFWVAVAGWNIGNLVMLAVIGVPLLRIGTPMIKRADLYIKSLL